MGSILQNKLPPARDPSADAELHEQKQEDRDREDGRHGLPEPYRVPLDQRRARLAQEGPVRTIREMCANL